MVVDQSKFFESQLSRAYEEYRDMTPLALPHWSRILEPDIRSISHEQPII